MKLENSIIHDRYLNETSDRGEMSLASAIERRHSVRYYNQEPVPRYIVSQVIAAGENSAALYPEIRVRWHMIWDGNAISQRLEGGKAVYDLSAGAPHYILAVSEERDGYMENMGFRMEQLILAATDLGLGTCWIGGMFSEEDMRPLIPRLRANERIIALTPVGYPATSPSAEIARHLLHWGTDHLSGRKPLSEIASQDIWVIPWAGDDKTLNHILEQIRLAPSWGNIQPWHLVIDDQYAILTVDHDPAKGNVRKGKPYYRLDGGIAMCHFYLAAQAAGWRGKWRIPEAAECKMLGDRYAIPTRYDILGVFPITNR